MYFRQLQQLLRRVTLAPIFATALLLAVGLSLFYYRQSLIDAEKQLDNLAAIAAEFSAPYLASGDIQGVETTLTSLIQHHYVKGVRILNKERRIVDHLGQRFIQKEPTKNWFASDLRAINIATTGIRRISHPVFADSQGNIIGWIDIGFDTSATRRGFIDMLIGIFALCLILPAIVALFIQDRISRLRPSLNSIEQGLHSIANGDYTNQVSVESNGLLKNLATDINQIASSVLTAQAELKRNIEHNIDELRETMETIEIQNIELDIARKRAIEASRVKSEFLANASHEFRTPLNGIIGFTQLLLKADISETQQEYLRTIESSAQGLLTIINDILDVSHIETGTVNLDYIPMRLETVIEETLQILAPTAFQNQLELVSMIEPELPQELVSDPLRIKQILTNLINNAIKFSNQKNILLEVSKDTSDKIKPTSAKSLVYRFEISGLSDDLNFNSEQDIQDLAELSSNVTELTGDNGFGLAISKGLIKALGGKMGVDHKGQSRILWFAIPLDQGTKSKAYVEKALTGLSVVICCDNTRLLTQIRQLTANWKLNALEVQDPLEVLPTIQKLTQAGKFKQLLIMDVPVLESKTTATSFLDQLTYQLNSDYHCKTLLLTTPAKQRELIEAELNRAVAFSAKPLIRDRLYKSICNHLNIYKQFYKPAKTQLLKNQTSKPKILAVDDNPANLLLVREFLTNLGTEVVTAANGEDAIRETDKQLFDLIFMDIQMPNMDGIETTREIRARAQDGVRVPVIALTAHTVNDRRSELLLAGLDDYLSKPITEEQLAHVISRWCNISPTKPITNKPLQAPDTTSVSSPSSAKAAETPKDKPARDSTLLSDRKVAKPVDIQLCLKLAGDKRHLARDMLSMLLDSLPTTLEQIDKAVQEQDLQTLEEIIHQVRGGAKCTGTPKLAEHSTRLDKMLFNKEYDDIYPALSDVTDAIEELLVWSEDYDLDTLFEVS